MGCETISLDQYLPLKNVEKSDQFLHNIIEEIFSYTLTKCPDVRDLLNFYEEVSPNKLTNEFILKELSWIAYAEGFRYDILRRFWPKIVDAFYDFNVIEVAFFCNDLDIQVEDICRLSGFKNPRKAKWCILNAIRILELDYELRDQGGLKGYFVNISKKKPTEIINEIPLILDTLKFKGIGKTTIFHLLKNVGVDIFKPDIHVCRILNKLGLVSSNPDISEVCEAMCTLASSYNMKLSEIDTLFFVYGKTTADSLPIRLL